MHVEVVSNKLVTSLAKLVAELPHLAAVIYAPGKVPEHDFPPAALPGAVQEFAERLAKYVVAVTTSTMDVRLALDPKDMLQVRRTVREGGLGTAAVGHGSGEGLGSPLTRTH